MRVTIFDILQWTLSPLAALVVLVVGVPYVKSTPSSYQSAARIWIQAQFPVPGGGDEQNNGSAGVYLPLTSFFNSPIKTAAELIRSEAVLGEARNTLLKKLPEAECPGVERMRGGLKIEDVKDTDVLAVKYSDRNPKIASLVLEAVIDGFLKLNSVQASANALRSREFLEAQVTQFRHQLVECRALLKAFQSKNGKMDLKAETTEFMERLAAKEKEIETTRVEIARTRERASYLKDAPLALENLSVKDPLVASMQERLALLNMQILQMSNRLKDSHPTMIALRSSMENTRNALEQRLSYYKQGKLPPDMVANLLPSEKSDRIDKLTDARAEASSLEKKLQQEIEGLTLLRLKMKELPELQVQFAELKHDEEQALSLVTEYERRLQNARLIETVAAGVTNIQVIDKPTVPNEPQGPSASLLTAATGILALFAAAAVWVAFMFLDPTISKVSTLVALLRFPLIATLGNLSAGPQKSRPRFEKLRMALMSKLSSCSNRVAVISATEGDGKTACVLGLAEAMSNSGHSVLIVEDVRNGALIHQKLSLTAPSGPFNLENCRNHITKVNENMGVISLGKLLPEQWSWDSDEGSQLLKDLGELAEVLVFDTEALSQSARALSLFSSPILPLVVVRWRRTNKDNIAALGFQLDLQNITEGFTVAWDTDIVKTTQTTPGAASTARPAVEEEAWA